MESLELFNGVELPHLVRNRAWFLRQTFRSHDPHPARQPPEHTHSNTADLRAGDILVTFKCQNAGAIGSSVSVDEANTVILCLPPFKSSECSDALVGHSSRAGVRQQPRHRVSSVLELRAGQQLRDRQNPLRPVRARIISKIFLSSVRK
jgi:hypothetical protein